MAGIRSLFIHSGWAGLLALTLYSGNLYAWQKVHPSALEWNALPRMCKDADFAGFIPPPGQHYVQLTKAEQLLKWRVGGWHYCTGLVKLFRAELMTDPQQRGEELYHGYNDLRYSYERINKRNPWAAQMGVAMARMLRLKHDDKKALEVLDQIRPLHPTYAPIYLAYAAILFDTKDYARAAKLLAEGNQATGDRNSELQYFLGLALFHTGDIGGARKYAAKAEANHFPMRYLQQQLAKYARQHPNADTPGNKN